MTQWNESCGWFDEKAAVTTKTTSFVLKWNENIIVWHDHCVEYNLSLLNWTVLKCIKLLLRYNRLSFLCQAKTRWVVCSQSLLGTRWRHIIRERIRKITFSNSGLCKKAFMKNSSFKPHCVTPCVMWKSKMVHFGFFPPDRLRDFFYLLLQCRHTSGCWWPVMRVCMAWVRPPGRRLRWVTRVVLMVIR